MVLVVGTSSGSMGVDLGQLPPGTQVVELPAEGELPREVKDIEFLVVSWAIRPRTAEIVSRARRKLKVLQVLSAGLDKVQPVEGVTLCSGRGAHDKSVADWVLAVILCMERRLTAFWDSQKEGRWNAVTQAMIRGESPSVGTMSDLDEKTALIVGHGSIGRAVEQRLQGFGTRVVGISRRPRPGVHTMDELGMLLPSADYVILLLPLTDETRHVVDAAFLAQMKQGALLVNAGRGPLVDHVALETALRAGRIRAALDVTEPEPLPDGHPLWSAPNLLITPHVAGAVAAWKQRVAGLARAQIWRYHRGEPLLNVAAGGY